MAKRIYNRIFKGAGKEVVKLARQRFIHPDIWNDKKIAKLSFTERLFFIGCFSNADDEGRMIGDPAYLRAIIFKYDDKNQQYDQYPDNKFQVSHSLPPV